MNEQDERAIEANILKLQHDLELHRAETEAQAAELRIANDEMKRLSQYLITVREDERRVLAGTLHHELGSLAVATGAYLDVAVERVTSGRMKEALTAISSGRSILNHCIANLKSLARDLRPPSFDIMGLAEALEQLVEQARSSTGLAIDFVDQKSDVAISPVNSIACYRFFQEALNNAVRHSKANRIHLSMAIDENGILASVNDDGIGFEWKDVEATRAGSMGLIAMSEMISAAGGSLVVDSELGQGTTLSASLPLPEEL